jgi:hypothetical protein
MKKPAFQLSSRGETLLRIAILALIAMAAGPEIFAAIEMQILLELLGAALFTTAFIAGARLVLLNLRDVVSHLLFPIAQLVVLRGDARRLVVVYMAAHFHWWMALAVACIAFPQAIVHLLR